MAQSKPELRSPLKDKTLRNPGQSVEADIRKAKDKFEEDALSIAVLGSFLVLELCQWVFNIPAKLMFGGVAVFLSAAVIFYTPKLARGRRNIQRLRQARDGERAVAECLDLLRDDGHRVFHDVVGPNCNIDHVVVGPKGVFTVETKTLNKRVGQDVHLRFDGKAVFVGEATLPDNPVPQALAQAGWLKQTLTDSTGKAFTVRPAVVFPGWFVEASGREAFWVLNPKLLRGKLDELPNCLEKNDVQLIAFHLKRYIRATNV